MSISGYVDYYCLWKARCLIDHSLDTYWRIQSQLTFQQLGHGRTRTWWGDVPRSIGDDGDGFFPGQRHVAISAILLLRLNVVSMPPISWSLLFQHTKIEDHLSSRLKTSGTFMQRRFPLTPLDAGSDASRSFIEWQEYVWMDSNNNEGECTRVLPFYSEERRVAVIGLYNDIPLATILFATPIKLRCTRRHYISISSLQWISINSENVHIFMYIN